MLSTLCTIWLISDIIIVFIMLFNFRSIISHIENTVPFCDANKLVALSLLVGLLGGPITIIWLLLNTSFSVEINKDEE